MTRDNTTYTVLDDKADKLTQAVSDFVDSKDVLREASEGVLELVSNSDFYALDDKLEAYVSIYHTLEATLKHPRSTTAQCELVCEILDRLALEAAEYVNSNPESVRILE